jgi:hypothetical protein
MIRNLKVLIATVTALAAFGATGATHAQALFEFHCSVEPCTLTLKPDGTGKTAHQVFIVKQGFNSLATTCGSLAGEATLAKKTASQITLKNLKETECSIAGSASEVVMNGCEKLLQVLLIGENLVITVTIKCAAGKAIEIKVPATGCLIKVGSQGPLSGIAVHDSETGGVKKTVLTAETFVTGVAASVNNKCPALSEGPVTGEYTTGNFEITAEEDKVSGAQKSIWWE